MIFSSLMSLMDRMRALGVRSLYAKALAENDNSKQQIYCGGSFDVLRQIPFTDLREETGGKRPNFKAGLNLYWIDSDNHTEHAAGAQLILYPDYPEVRLSGFLRGCSIAPSEHMRPVAANQRRHNNGPDGRVLLLGVTNDRTIYAFLATPDTPVAREFTANRDSGNYGQTGVFWDIPLAVKQDNLNAMIAEIRRIHEAGWHAGQRLNSAGKVIPYTARNGGGYTLEALLGIKPNAATTPDFLGYEIKAYSKSRVTLMTPEPDVGLYGEQGAEAFVRKYGRRIGGDVIYFTGSHKVDHVCSASGQTLKLDGFDPEKCKITKVDGGIVLEDSAGKTSAGWSFKGLIEHWCRKHASAAYVPYSSKEGTPPMYWYRSPIYVGVGTSFEKYLKSMHEGDVIYDPGSKVTDASTAHSRVKARSQFRISIRKLHSLYSNFEPYSL